MDLFLQLREKILRNILFEFQPSVNVSVTDFHQKSFYLSFLHNAPGLKSQCSSAVWLMHCRWHVINLHLRPSSLTFLVYPERPSGPQSTCRPHPLWTSVSSAERAAHPQSGRNSVSQESEKSQKIFIIYPLKQTKSGEVIEKKLCKCSVKLYFSYHLLWANIID